MTDKLKCCFCGSELENACAQVIYFCPNDECHKAKDWYASKQVWQALIQAKQGLEIAKSYVKGISEMVINSSDNIYIVIGHFKKLAEQTLEQIEHKGQQ